MKRLTTIVAVLVILGLALPSFVFAQDEGANVTRGERRGARPGAGRGRPGGPGAQPDRQAQRPRVASVQHLFRVALLASRAREDAELQSLVDEAIKCRKDLLKLQEKRMGIFEDLVAAIRAENKDLAKAKTKEMKAAGKEIATKAKELSKTVHDMAKRLREIMPEAAEKLEPRAEGWLGEGGPRGPEARRGLGRPGRGAAQPESDNVDELPLDIY